MELKVLAQRDDTYLIQVDNDSGRVYDEQDGTLYLPQNLMSILIHGYWEEFTGDPSPILINVKKLLKEL